MANITLQEPLSQDELAALLRRRCPDLDLGSFGPAVLVSSSAWVAVGVNIHAKTISLVPMVSGGKMLLVLLLVALTGIGAVLYAVLAVPKQQALVKRVRELLERELRGAR